MGIHGALPLFKAHWAALLGDYLMVVAQAAPSVFCVSRNAVTLPFGVECLAVVYKLHVLEMGRGPECGRGSPSELQNW